MLEHGFGMPGCDELRRRAPIEPCERLVAKPDDRSAHIPIEQLGGRRHDPRHSPDSLLNGR